MIYTPTIAAATFNNETITGCHHNVRRLAEEEPRTCVFAWQLSVQAVTPFATSFVFYCEGGGADGEVLAGAADGVLFNGVFVALGLGDIEAGGWAGVALALLFVRRTGA
jgi:hypothetical protein